MTVVTQDPGQSRFTATVDGVLCVLDYQLQADVMAIVHTGVPSQVGGPASRRNSPSLRWTQLGPTGGKSAPCAPTPRSTCAATLNTTTCAHKRPTPYRDEEILTLGRALPVWRRGLFPLLRPLA